jgi:predicted RNA-binding Zn-ribbon protein involved in translation (DUF1610 family)
MARWVLASTACPNCGVRCVIYVHRYYKARPVGTFSLAGQGMKFAATVAYEYLCSNCGVNGESYPKHDYPPEAYE